MRGLLGGTDFFQRVAEFGPLHGTGNDVKCLPSKKFCPTRNIVGVPRKPRGAGELRLTGHSGFSAVRGQITRSSTDVIRWGPPVREEGGTRRFRRFSQSFVETPRCRYRT